MKLNSVPAVNIRPLQNELHNIMMNNMEVLSIKESYKVRRGYIRYNGIRYTLTHVKIARRMAANEMINAYIENELDTPNRSEQSFPECDISNETRFARIAKWEAMRNEI